ncbi:MAG: hypothetical protein EXS32_07215 [Opitutus sp.]|nr:hypothetical protein [Opitutus sp.]
MNTVPARKLVSLLSRFAALGLAAFVLGVTFDAQALALFALAAGALVLLIAAGDYAPRPRAWQPHRASIVNFPPAALRPVATAKLAA